MRKTLVYRKLSAICMALTMAYSLHAQLVVAPDDVVVTCEFQRDAQGLLDMTDPTYGRMVSSVPLREPITTLDRVDALFCTEYFTGNVIYHQGMSSPRTACEYFNDLYDPTKPDSMYTLDWGMDGYYLNADSVRVDTSVRRRCGIIEIRRRFTAFRGSLQASDVQSIYVIIDAQKSVDINENRIGDTTDCLKFFLLDTVYTSECSSALDFPSPHRFQYPEVEEACGACFDFEQLVVEYRDSLLTRRANGFQMNRVYYVINWCTGDVLTLNDTFEVVCIPINLNGVVYYDSIEDCSYQPSEPGFWKWNVKATGPRGEFISSTNGFGVYNFGLPAGTYDLSLEPPSHLWEPCTNFGTVMVDNSGTVVVKDLGVQADTICPDPFVHVELPRFRRCRETVIPVYFGNNGTEALKGGEVIVDLDPNIEVLDANYPYQDLGNNRYLFEVGDLPIGYQRVVTIVVKISCSGVRVGQSLCVEAELHPLDSCASSLNSPSIEATASCIGDSVKLQLRNKGADMTVEGKYWVIEEDLIMFMERFKLQNGEQVSETFLADGTTFTIVSENAGATTLRSVAGIEGCNPVDPTNFSIGFLNQFAPNHPTKTKFTACRTVTAAFDPNDKISSPEGFGEDNEIFPDQQIHYTIRFQNTGNDTAFNVVLVDSLDKSLDLSTFRFLASSHDVSPIINPEGVLTCYFNDIYLPDSSVNQEGSKGFFSFSIEPIDSIAPGQKIGNHADIYFDLEAPIRTNTVQLKIFEELTTRIQAKDIHSEWVKIFPNPTRDRLIVNLNLDRAKFLVYDLAGNPILTGDVQRGGNVIDFNNLVAGMYTIQIIHEAQFEVFKILVQN